MLASACYGYPGSALLGRLREAKAGILLDCLLSRQSGTD